MTTNVADYIITRRTDHPLDGWPADKLADGWRVGCYINRGDCVVYFNDKDSNYDLSIVLTYHWSPNKLYMIDRCLRLKEEFFDILRSQYPIAFEWCLFNLDLIGA